jgi:hypothetical protein
VTPFGEVVQKYIIHRLNIIQKYLQFPGWDSTMDRPLAIRNACRVAMEGQRLPGRWYEMCEVRLLPRDRLLTEKGVSPRDAYSPRVTIVAVVFGGRRR